MPKAAISLALLATTFFARAAATAATLLGMAAQDAWQELLLGPTPSQRLASSTVNVFPFNVTGSAGAINGVEAVANTPTTEGKAALALMGWSVGLEGFNMKVFTLPPCSIYLPHIHGQSTELIFILEGTMWNVVAPDMGFTDAEFVGNYVSGAAAYEYEAPTDSVIINPRGALHTNVNYGCAPVKILLIHMGTQAGFFFIPPGDLVWPAAVLDAVNMTDVAASHLQPNPPMLTSLNNSFCGC